MNKYLEKIAKVMDMGDDGKPKKHSFSEQRDLNSRADKAKHVNPDFKPSPAPERAKIPVTKGFVSNNSKLLKRVAMGAGLTAKVGVGMYAFHHAKKHLENKGQEKVANIRPIQTPGEPTPSQAHKSDLAQTGVIAASGAVTGEGANMLWDKLTHNGAKAGAKAVETAAKSIKGRLGRMGTIGGLGVLGDYAAVKINKHLAQEKQANHSSHSGQSGSGIHIKKQNKGLLHKVRK
jgi:hypothetical protein